MASRQQIAIPNTKLQQRLSPPHKVQQDNLLLRQLAQLLDQQLVQILEILGQQQVHLVQILGHNMEHILHQHQDTTRVFGIIGNTAPLLTTTTMAVHGIAWIIILTHHHLNPVMCNMKCF